MTGAANGRWVRFWLLGCVCSSAGVALGCGLCLRDVVPVCRMLGTNGALVVFRYVGGEWVWFVSTARDGRFGIGGDGSWLVLC